MIFKMIASLALSVAFISCGSISGSGGSGGTPTLPPSKVPPAIFKSYSSIRNATMADGWTRGFNMSGVSFDDTRTATLITSRHVVMAKHYARNAGAAVVFHDHSGQYIQRKLVGFAAGAGDVMVGLLDEAVPSNYRPYPLPAVSSPTSALVGRHVIVSDQNRNLFVHLVAGFGGGGIAFKHDVSDRHGWSKNLVPGDSGHPSFLIVDNQLVLLETHSTGGPGAGPYYGDATIQASVRAAVAQLDPSYQIRTVNVP